MTKTFLFPGHFSSLCGTLSCVGLLLHACWYFCALLSNAQKWGKNLLKGGDGFVSNIWISNLHANLQKTYELMRPWLYVSTAETRYDKKRRLLVKSHGHYVASVVIRVFSCCWCSYNYLKWSYSVVITKHYVFKSCHVYFSVLEKEMISHWAAEMQYVLIHAIYYLHEK